jgi:hypothetical protein
MRVQGKVFCYCSIFWLKHFLYFGINNQSVQQNATKQILLTLPATLSIIEIFCFHKKKVEEKRLLSNYLLMLETKLLVFPSLMKSQREEIEDSLSFTF